MLQGSTTSSICLDPLGPFDGKVAAVIGNYLITTLIRMLSGSLHGGKGTYSYMPIFDTDLMIQHYGPAIHGQLSLSWRYS